MAGTGNSEEGRREVGIAYPGGEEALGHRGMVALAFRGRLEVGLGVRLAEAYRAYLALVAFRACQRVVVEPLKGALEKSDKWKAERYTSWECERGRWVEAGVLTEHRVG